MITLSIDFGTSNTVAALERPGRAPHTLEFEGSGLLPSAVFLADDHTLLVGREALRSARIDPSRFEANPKRRIDEGEVLLGATPVPVVDLIAAVLQTVRDEAARQTGGSAPDTVILTHPAQWGAPRRNVLLAAARAAGLANITMLPEPVAAAAQFTRIPGRELSRGGTVAVYDLGGGTFDVAVIGRPQGSGEGELSVLAEGGLPDLGGLDFDQALLEHASEVANGVDADAWSRVLRPSDASSRRAARALAEDIRSAKESLSRYPQTDLAMPDPMPDVHVTRDEFESLIRAQVMRSVVVLEETIRQAGTTPQRLAGIFLVGGSSRIPLVARTIQEVLGVTPAALDQPETAVALGALTLPRSTDTVRTTQAGLPGARAADSAVTTSIPARRAVSAEGHTVRREPRSSRPLILAGAVVLIAAIAAATVLLLPRSANRAVSPETGSRPLVASPMSEPSSPVPPVAVSSPVVRSSVRSAGTSTPRSTPPSSVFSATPATTVPATTALLTSRVPALWSRTQSVAYRQGYQVAREDTEAFVPASGDQAERVIATRCSDDRRSFIGGAQSRDWIDGCFAGTLDAVEDSSAVDVDGLTAVAVYRVGYQTGRDHHTEIAARDNGDLAASCSYEAHLAEVEAANREDFVGGCVDGAAQAEALSVPTDDRRTAPEPIATVQTTTTPVAPVDPGDLDLTVPISSVPCDGEFVVLVGAAVTPGAYGTDVQRFLTDNPGTSYLRTGRECTSLVQNLEGNPIYAVFFGPVASRSVACSISEQLDGSTVKQLIDSGEPLADEQC